MFVPHNKKRSEYHDDKKHGERSVALGDLLDLLDSLLPHEVTLCDQLVQALRCSPVIAGTRVAAEVDIRRALAPFAGKGSHKVSGRLQSLLEPHDPGDRNSSRPGTAEGRPSTAPSSRPGTPAERLSTPRDKSDLSLGDACEMDVRHQPSSGTHLRALAEDPEVVMMSESPRLPSVPSSEWATVNDKADYHVNPLDMDEPEEQSVRSTREAAFPWFPQGTANWRQFLFHLFERDDGSLCGRFVACIIMIAIMVSTITFVLESVPRYRERPAECEALRQAGAPLTVEACEPKPFAILNQIENVCVVIFVLDYGIRIATVHSAVAYGTFKEALFRTLRYARQPHNIIDFLAILPVFVDLVLPNSPKHVMKILKVIRILRILKIGRHHPGLSMFAEVIILSGQPLFILIMFNIMVTALFGSLVYFAEGRRFSVASQFTEPGDDGASALFPTGVYVRLDQTLEKDVPTPFRSLPMAFWWVCTTMTTVGYGDISPTTPEGKLIGVLCFFVGIVFLALPISVLGANFEEVYDRYIETGLIGGPRRRKSECGPSGALITNERKRKWLPQGGLFNRRGVFMVLEDPQATSLGHLYSLLMTAVIMAATMVFILESLPELNSTPAECVPGQLTVKNCQPYPALWLKNVETVCIVLFTFDYIARVGCVHVCTPEECGLVELGECSPLKVTLLYARGWLNLVDLLAIAPFYIEIAFSGLGFNFAVVRVLRLVRVFRILKQPKMRYCVGMFGDIITESLPALLMLVCMMGMASIFFASMIVFAEGSTYSVDFEPDKYPYGVYVRPTVDGHDREATPFVSIVYSFWWFFVTATTVGYGDDVPTTTAGRWVGVLAFYCGIVCLAMPITVVSATFRKHYCEWLEECRLAREDALRRSAALGTVVFDPGTEDGDGPVVTRAAWS